MSKPPLSQSFYHDYATETTNTVVFLDAEWLKEILDIRETKWKSLDMETVFNP